MASLFVDCEYGLLREVLLSPPSPTDGTFLDGAAAADQHRALAAQLRGAGIRCRMAPAVPSLPLGCYVRDSVVPTPWGLMVPRMGFAVRDGEPAAIERLARAAGADVWCRIQHGTIEGGDVMLLRPGVAAIGCNGERTSRTGALEARGRFLAAGWACRIVEYAAGFRHLDVALGVVDGGNVLCCPDALSAADVTWVGSLGFAVHPVPADEAQRMACNIVALGGGRVLACKGNARGTALLRDLGCAVLEADLDAFVADSGGVHCVVQAWRRDPA